MRYIELKCYIYILRDTASYRNDFFYPHGALFSLVPSRCLAFFLVVVWCALVVPWSCGDRVWSYYVFVRVAVAGFACYRVFPIRKAFTVWSCALAVCPWCTPGARSGRDNNRITLILILWKNTILMH